MTWQPESCPPCLWHDVFQVHNLTSLQNFFFPFSFVFFLRASSERNMISTERLIILRYRWMGSFTCLRAIMAWHDRTGLGLSACIDMGVESDWVGIVYCYMSSLQCDVRIEKHYKKGRPSPSTTFINIPGFLRHSDKCHLATPAHRHAPLPGSTPTFSEASGTSPTPTNKFYQPPRPLTSMTARDSHFAPSSLLASSNLGTDRWPACHHPYNLYATTASVLAQV